MARYTDYEKRLRARYSRTSTRIRQQLTRLNKKYPNNIVNEQYRDQFPTLKELGDISIKGLELLNRRATGVYKSKVLTLKGYTQALSKSMNTLKEAQGFEWVDMDNIADVWKFVDDMRARGLADIYGYQFFIGMYNRISNSNISSAQLQSTINEWTNYAKDYSERVEKARELGRETPKPKRLRLHYGKRGSSN